MFDVMVVAEFTDDTHQPNWLDGESFTYRGFLPAVPPVGTEITGVKDHDGRSYTVAVSEVGMTVDSAMVRVTGTVK